MKEIILLVLAFNVHACASSQEQFVKLVKEFYRVNPLEGKFSTFIYTLSEDPDLQDKQLIRKTDTSNFFLRGTYKIFNPFGTNANKVEMVFTEQQVEEVVKNIQSLQTVYTYQMLAYFDDTEANRKLIVKDYNQLKRRLRGEMKSRITNLNGLQQVEAGEIADYYYADSYVYPITLSWQTLSKSKKLALTLITKFEVMQNRAVSAGGFTGVRIKALDRNEDYSN